jgi:hypothetical protein
MIIESLPRLVGGEAPVLVAGEQLRRRATVCRRAPTVLIPDDQTRVRFLDGPGRREAARGRHGARLKSLIYGYQSFGGSGTGALFGASDAGASFAFGATGAGAISVAGALFAAFASGALFGASGAGASGTTGAVGF